MSDIEEFEDFGGGPTLEMGEEFAEEMLGQRWGHPVNWPVPERKRPKWYQFEKRKLERELLAGIEQATGLTEITQEMRDMWWKELRKGQGVYEDAGGFFWRAYSVMLGFRSADPVYGYDEAVTDLLKEPNQ